MVLVDVVMVRTEDSITTTRGVNLLSALSMAVPAACHWRLEEEKRRRR